MQPAGQPDEVVGLRQRRRDAGQARQDVVHLHQAQPLPQRHEARHRRPGTRRGPECGAAVGGARQLHGRRRGGRRWCRARGRARLLDSCVQAGIKHYRIRYLTTSIVLCVRGRRVGSIFFFLFFLYIFSNACCCLLIGLAAATTGVSTS